MVSSASQAAAVAATLGNPQVRLWYEESGRLSANIAPPKSVTLWNTCIGEGDAQEDANDALFTIEVRTAGQQNVRPPLTLVATDGKGKILARRTITNVLTSDAGRATLALWVPNVGCGVGKVVFSARMGTASRSVSLSFDGGE
jgi:hypothetical protein